MRKFCKVMLVIAGAAFGLSIILLAVGAGLGGFSIRNAANEARYETEDYDIDFSGDIKKLDFKFNLGEVRIVRGDRFNLTVKNGIKDSFDDAAVVGSTLIIHERNYNVYDSVVNFDWRNIFGLVSHNTISVTVTLPEDFEAEYIIISTGVGDVRVDTLTGETINLNTGVGETNINLLKAGKIEGHFGVGDINIEELISDDIDISCGVGSTDIGSVNGKKLVLETSTGELNVKNGITAENVKLKSGTGCMEINGVTAQSLDAKSGVGEMDIYNVDLVDINLDTGTGSAYVSGKITGDIDVVSGVGSVDFDLVGDGKDYSIEAKKGTGDITFNGEEIEGNFNNSSADKTIVLNGGVGSITVSFSDKIPVHDNDDDDRNDERDDDDTVTVNVGGVVKTEVDGDRVKVDIGDSGSVEVDGDDVDVNVGPIKVKTNT